MKLENREATLDARPILGRALLLAAFGLVAGLMLAMSASQASAQEGGESPPQIGPEQALFTGVLQSEENRFVFSDFFLVNEQFGGLYTLKSSVPPNEGGIALSEFVGERVRVQVIPMPADTPSSSESSNSTPAFVTRLEVLSQGERFGEVVPAGEPCDAESLPSSQVDECMGTQDQYAEDPPPEDPPEVPPEVVQNESSNAPSNAPNVACSELGDSGEQAQQGAQEILSQYPSDPNGLDADGDGIPCEFVESTGKTSYEDGSVVFITTAGSNQAGDTSGDQYDAPADEPTEGDTPADQPVAEQVTVLPDTGGASLYTLGAGALLLAGGLVSRRIIR